MLQPPVLQRDQELIQIVDAALAEAQRRSGSWLACRRGCVQCCIGPFPITPLDGARLRAGLAELAVRDPQRAGRVQQRAHASVARFRRDFPEDPIARVLEIEDAADDEPCPALDPQSGACDLYSARPITCRTFGPAVRFPSAPEQHTVAVCELCYVGASDGEIAACEVEVDTRLESEILHDLEKLVGGSRDTLVAFALAEAS
jgi:Fe-S-cluster containining protein